MTPSDQSGTLPAALDTSKPNVARAYDYLLGGKDNFAADRAVGDQIIASLPAVQVGVRAQRDLLGRIVRYLVGEAGIRQLLDIGSGLPTAENVHQIAPAIDARTRVVYLDNAPVVLTHAFIHHMLDSEDPASATLQAAMEKGLGRSKFRTFAQIEELFDGLELVEPGVVLVPDWRPDPGTPGVDNHPVLRLAAVGVAANRDAA